VREVVDGQGSPEEAWVIGSERPVGAHLVGSVPLTDAEAVFCAAATVLGPYLRRVPDGETGERSNWIAWQKAVLRSCPDLELVPVDSPASVPGRRLQLREGRSADPVKFGSLGYASAAIASYGVFARLRSAGVLPNWWRFQVCLPTPLAPIGVFVAGHDQAAIEPAYEAAMMRELDELLAGIPHDDLALQWDTAVEFGMLEGVFPAWFDEVEEGVVDRLLRLGRRVPTDVPLGYHLCYGDAGHKHFTEPEDTAKLARTAQSLLDGLGRPLGWIHLPVPRARDDEGYFEPLRELRLPEETELYLGVVHLTDGPLGTQRRIDAARRVLPFPFGVATECGFGRRPPETISDLMQIHAEVAAPIAPAD